MSTQTPWKHDEAVRSEIERFTEEHELTHAQAAQRIKLSSATRFAKYLGLKNPENVAETDMPRVEAAVRNFLRHQARRAAHVKNLFETSVSRAVEATIKQARRTGDMVLIHGPAGSGKSCGAELFCRNNPNTILVTATKDQRCARAMRNMVFEQLAHDQDSKGRGYSGSLPRWEWITAVLTGSERVVVVDSAQRLTLGALEWCADLNDATGTAIAFLGNPEVLKLMRLSDQLSSRIGIVTEVRIRKDEAAIAKELVEQFAKAGNGELAEAVLGIVGEAGHARRAKKHLQLTAAIKDGDAGLSWGAAFEAAGKKLLKPNFAAIKK